MKYCEYIQIKFKSFDDKCYLIFNVYFLLFKKSHFYDRYKAATHRKR